jgi:hypothetical protein
VTFSGRRAAATIAATLAVAVLAVVLLARHRTEPSSNLSPSITASTPTSTGRAEHPTLKTDRESYLPGDLVHLQGTGFALGSVQIVVTNHYGQARQLQATVSPVGSISIDFIADPLGASRAHWISVAQGDVTVGLTYSVEGK